MPATSTPIVLSICDYLFLGRMLPNLRSFGCLVLLLLGSVCYVLADSVFELEAYLWVTVW